MTDESSQRSATLTNVVAIRGGGIPLDAGCTNSWIVVPEVVEGHEFVDIYTSDYKCKKYLDGHYSMINHIKKIRDFETAEAMRNLAAEDDPNDMSPSDGSLPNRPRRELIDLIPRILELSVETRSGVVAVVKVLPSWRGKGVLQIELTRENMDLLLEDPPAASAPPPFTPTITQPDVIWITGRNHVRCTYWHSKKNAWKIKSKLIDFDPTIEADAMQEIVDREAGLMQDFFLAHHNRLDNMPCNEESAESASEEPRAKAARCSGYNGSEGNRFATASAESAPSDANHLG